MSTWGILLLLVIIGIYVAILFILPILYSGSRGFVDSDTLNTQLFKDKLGELDRDLENNDINQQQFDVAVTELKKQLLEDSAQDSGQYSAGIPERNRYLVIASIGLAMPMLVFLLYYLNGQSENINPNKNNPHLAITKNTSDKKHPGTGASTNKQTNNPGQNAGQSTKRAAPSKEKVKLFIKDLEKKIQADPRNATRWIMLAKSHAFIRDPANALLTYEKAMAYHKNNAEVLANYADQLAAAHGGKLEGKPLEHIEKALKINANEPLALNLLGTYYYRKADYKTALKHWQKLQKLLPNKSLRRRQIERAIADAHQKLGISYSGQPKSGQANQQPPNPVPSNTGKTTASPFIIKGTISIDANVKKGLKGSETVFIFAQAANGPKMPLAAIKKTVNDLPYAFKLDDSMAMTPAFKLSKFNKVKVIARIVKGNGVKAQAGDLQDESQILSKGILNDIKINISTTVK